jgi:hypothetical protein
MLHFVVVIGLIGSVLIDAACIIVLQILVMDFDRYMKSIKWNAGFVYHSPVSFGRYDRIKELKQFISEYPLLAADKGVMKRLRNLNAIQAVLAGAIIFSICSLFILVLL